MEVDANLLAFLLIVFAQGGMLWYKMGKVESKTALLDENVTKLLAQNGCCGDDEKKEKA